MREDKELFLRVKEYLLLNFLNYVVERLQEEEVEKFIEYINSEDTEQAWVFIKERIPTIEKEFIAFMEKKINSLKYPIE